MSSELVPPDERVLVLRTGEASDHVKIFMSLTKKMRNAIAIKMQAVPRRDLSPEAYS